jgi:hypothetical protein
MLGKYRTDLLLLLHNLPLLRTLHIGINALHGDAPSIVFPTSLSRNDKIISSFEIYHPKNNVHNQDGNHDDNKVRITIFFFF